MRSGLAQWLTTVSARLKGRHCARRVGPPGKAIMRFGKLNAEIGSRTDISKGCKILCWALDMIHNPKTGQCNPSISALMVEMGERTKSTVRQYIKEAEKFGLIERIKGKFEEQDFILSWKDKFLPTVTAQKNDQTAQKNNQVTLIMNEKEKEKKKEKENEKEDELSFADMVLKEAARIGAEMEKN